MGNKNPFVFLLIFKIASSLLIKSISTKTGLNPLLINHSSDGQVKGGRIISPPKFLAVNVIKFAADPELTNTEYFQPLRPFFLKLKTFLFWVKIGLF